jgi:hypothetical protein
MIGAGGTGMIKRKGTILIAAAAVLGLIALASPDHRANIQILTHRPGDLAPQRAQAVVDLGLASVSVLVTWSRQLGY